MKTLTRFLLLLSIIIVYAAASFHGMTYWHEKQHAEIFREAGCENIRIEYEYFDFDKTSAKTLAYCYNQDGEPRHEKVHQKQKILTALWMASVIFLEIILLRVTQSQY